jgi:2-polyprenyl-6-methoxyphenol hydroxylase-like FAD-dependent oxidoreductase
MSNIYDAIIVGARCAGAPTAMLLARRGYRVLLVDRASFPSDTVSTLLIHPRGVAALRRWGLLDEVTTTGCPPTDTYSFDFGAFMIRGTPHPIDGASVAYAPRRTVLDSILVDAAGRAGAEVRERFTVEEVLIEDGTVTGLRGHDDGGRTVVEHARVVVGADGRNSRVARAVHAPEYHQKPPLNWPYYTYWSGFPVEGFETFVGRDRGGGAIPTNDGLTLLIVGWPIAEANAYKADPQGNYLKTLEMFPSIAERARTATREDRFYGGSSPNYFRQPYGPGWVLIGDAGYNKDPITAQGISDAFGDAEACAVALDDVFAGRRSFDVAMRANHQARDARAMPIYEFTTALATLEPPPPDVAQRLASLPGDQPAMDAFASVIAGSLSPLDFFAPATA